MPEKKAYNQIRTYTKQDLMKLDESKAEPLIQDFLFERDYVMIVAPPKMGKSILADQIACNLSSGTPLFDTFDISKPMKVWIFKTEGKDEDNKDRFIRMSHAIPMNPDNIVMFCSAGFRFNTPHIQRYLQETIKQYKDELPKVIIIDALYRAIKGSLKDDETVNEFHDIVGKLADVCDAAVIIVHHMKKPARNPVDGSIYDRSSNDAYGSTFLLGSVDHCFWMEKCDKNPKHKMIRCDEQRSGNIIDDIRVELIEPDPLYFKTVYKNVEELKKVTDMLKSNSDGYNVSELMKKTRIKKTIMYRALKELLSENKIEKYGTKVKVYKLK
jgi:hypothetical protein